MVPGVWRSSKYRPSYTHLALQIREAFCRVSQEYLLALATRAASDNATD